MDLQNVIAIVGMGCAFPDADTPEAFWQLIRDGRDTVRPVDQNRWGQAPETLLEEAGPRPDKAYSLAGCFVDDAALQLDWGNLHITPQRLAQLDPLFKVGLYAAQQAWKNAKTEQVHRQRTGVLIGNIVLPTQTSSALTREILGERVRARVLGEAPSSGATHPDNRKGAGLPAGFIAEALGFGGSCATLDAACASSLYAIHLAAQALREGKLDAVISGGLSRPDCLYTQMGFSQLKALSAKGWSSPFDEQADGLIVGEGAGFFVLKRLSDALAHGDTVHGIIAGTGLSNDRDGSLLAPSSEGQLRAMRSAYAQAGWRPDEVAMIECHATGTPLGDRVEFESLLALWEGSAKGKQAVIGSVKSNIGHLLTAAGAASLMKVLLSLRHREIPPTARFQRPGLGIHLQNSPFRVLQQAEAWPQDGARKAAVSAFGFGGINAHLLVQAYDEPMALPKVNQTPGERDAVAVVGLAARVGHYAHAEEVARVLLGLEKPHAPAHSPAWAEKEEKLYPIDHLDIPLGAFRIPPNELREMLPQQLLALELTRRALSETQLSEDTLQRTGVFLGIGLDPNTANFQLRWGLEQKAKAWAKTLGRNLSQVELAEWAASLKDSLSPALNANRVLGALGGMVASRVAREYRVGGPSFTFSAEEHSGLAALETALQSLATRQLDVALVGAVEFGCDLRTARAEFETQAEAVNDGGVVLVLKRLQDALRDGDTVYAKLDDLQTAHQTASSQGEAAGVGRITESDSDLSDASISIDATQFPSLHALGGNRAAAGLLQVFASIMALHYRVYPANGRPQYWLRNRHQGPRRANVMTRSSEGSIARVNVSEHAPERSVRSLAKPAFFAILLSGETREELAKQVRELRARAQQPGTELIQVACEWWLSKKPKPLQWRVGFLVRSLEKLVSRLNVLAHALADYPENPGDHPELGKWLRGNRVFFSKEDPLDPEKVAFVFPGSGSQFPDMGRLLGLYFPQIFDEQDRVTDYFRDQLRPDLFWSHSSTDGFKNQHRALLSAQVALGVVTHDVVTAFGVRPRAVIGYSLGESSALFATRAWTARDEMHCRTQDSPLFQELLAGKCDAARQVWNVPPEQPVDWVIGVVNRQQQTVRETLEKHPRAYLLIVNTPNECVIGGAREQVMAAVEELGANFFPLHGVVTVHCEVMEPAAQAYHDHHLFETSQPENVDFYSGGWGERFAVSRESAAKAILTQARHGVDFPKTIRAAYADGYRVFVEMGPGSSCTRMIGEILKGQPHEALSVSRPGPKALRQFLRSMAQLFSLGLPVDVSPLFNGLPRRSWDREVVRTLRIPVEHGLPEPVLLKPENQDEGTTMKQAIAPAKVQPTPNHPGPQGSVRPPSAPLPSKVQLESREKYWMEGALDGMGVVATSNHQAHDAFLRVAQLQAETLQQVAQFQRNLAGQAVLAGQPISQEPPAILKPKPILTTQGTGTTPAPSQAAASRDVAFDRELCLEFACGSIAAVLGPEFAKIDSHPTRVRLPDEPLMLVDRILHVEGETLKRGRVVTEHDVKPHGWYLDGGRIPTCVAVEAGQADLFLSAYLGIDFETQGHAVYRLLDAEVTFHDDLPQPGKVIHYDIHIDHFFRQGQTYLFRFRFDGTVDGKPLLTMRNGCAGFFSEAELEAGKGIVRNPRAAELNPHQGESVEPLVPMQVESYSDAQLIALRKGDLAGCFGPLFAQLPLQRPMTLPDGVMNLVDRVLLLEPQGGPYGLGFIRAEADIHPDDWFLTCHFVDDKVMPGTLMYECCLHSLRIYLLRMGWIGEEGQVAYQPIKGIKSRLKCRGQVLETTQKVRYEIMIKALGYNPEPYAIVDALMYSDEKCIVEIGDMSIRLSGLTREAIENLWKHECAATQPVGIQKPALFDSASILAFAVGKPSEAFGEPYRVFDSERIIARLPGPPFMLTDRITALGTPQWQVQAGGTVQAQYDVPPDAWYFQENQQRIMPFSVLLEIALQPCGWMAAYMGSALTSDQDLKFRNLGGSATLLRPVTAQTGTLTIDIACTKVSASGGMIIQNFDFLVSDAAGAVYQGDTYFGFFSKEALAKQVGLRNAVLVGEAMRNQHPTMAYPQGAPYPAARMRMLDRIVAFHPQGGEAGLGVIVGEMDVDPSAWFFKAHFHQDPVVPGSLGLESFLQLLKVVAVDRWQLNSDAQFETVASGVTHVWEYRGQVIPRNDKVTVEATITAADDTSQTLQAAGILSVDGIAIYRMQHFSLRVVR